MDLFMTLVADRVAADNVLRKVDALVDRGRLGRVTGRVRGFGVGHLSFRSGSVRCAGLVRQNWHSEALLPIWSLLPALLLGGRLNAVQPAGSGVRLRG